MYKIYEYRKPLVTKYAVLKHIKWFKWSWIRDLSGGITIYDTRKGAQAYINQMNKLHNEKRRPCCLYRCFNKTR